MWAAARTLREVADSSSASEQVPDEEQGIHQSGEAGRGPDHDVSEQVDLCLRAHRETLSPQPRCHSPEQTRAPTTPSALAAGTDVQRFSAP